MFIINPYRFAAATPNASISFTDSASDGSDGTGYTFSARSLGAAASDRFIVVGAGQRNSGQTVSSLTIGGVSASLIKRQVGASGFNVTELWGATVPTGTTGDITVTWSASVVRCAIAVHRIVNLTSTTPTFTVGSTTDPMSVLINVEGGGVAVAFSYGGVNGTNTWTGLTEDVDALVESQCYSAASAAFSSAQSSLSVTCDGSIAYTDPTMAVAAFR